MAKKYGWNILGGHLVRISYGVYYIQYVCQELPQIVRLRTVSVCTKVRDFQNYLSNMNEFHSKLVEDTNQK